MSLTEEQMAILYLLGKPDDGSEEYPPFDADRVARITHELITLGLVSDRGKDSAGKRCYDLTDPGELVYQKIGDMDLSILVAGQDTPQHKPK